MARVRICGACLQPAGECICIDGDEDSPEVLRRAVREADERKTAPWEYDGDPDAGSGEGQDSMTVTRP